jgi:hypothetical protein
MIDERTGEVIPEKLIFPVRRDSYGKAYVKLYSRFPEDFIQAPYGSLELNLGAFKVKFIEPNLAEEEVAEELAELIGRDVAILIRFKMLKLRKGIKELNLTDLVPEGKSGATCKSEIVFPVFPTGFGELSGELVREGDRSILKLPEGELELDFAVPAKGKVVLAYGISKLVVRELEENGKESSVEYNLLSVY